MELRYYRYFIAVAEELHFGKAAERLHISQPPLSMQIKALEEELGGKLLVRNNRNVSLTQAGTVFLEQARATVKQADMAIERTKAVLQGHAVNLNIAYTGSAIFSGIFGAIVRKFKQHYPIVTLNVQEMTPNRQLEALQNQQIHLGFLTVLALAIPPDIATLPLASWQMVLAVERNHPLAQQEQVRIADLHHAQFVTYKKPYQVENMSFIHYLLGFEPQALHYADDMMQMLALVSAGIGVALIPQSLSASAMQENIVYKHIVDINNKMDCLLAFNRNQQEAVVQSFINTAAQCIEGKG